MRAALPHRQAFRSAPTRETRRRGAATGAPKLWLRRGTNGAPHVCRRITRGDTVKNDVGIDLAGFPQTTARFASMALTSGLLLCDNLVLPLDAIQN